MNIIAGPLTFFDQNTNTTKLIGVVSWGKGKSEFCNLDMKDIRDPESLQVVGGLVILESMAKLRKFLTGYTNTLVYLVRLKKYQKHLFMLTSK